MKMILVCAVSGIIGTGLGGLITAVLLKRPNKNIACWMLSFSAGVMISIVCFGLIPETIELAGVLISMLGLGSGVAIIMVLHRIVDKMAETKGADGKPAESHDNHFHNSGVVGDRSAMIRSGIMMVIAVGLHNIPAGMAIGVGGSHDFQLGLILALMMLLHNIPEGMAISTPLLSGGMKPYKSVLVTALSGAPTLLGGLIGLISENISNTAIALAISAAGGAMLYTVFGEILPQSVVMAKNRAAAVVTLIGILVGLAVALA